jgi:ribosomal protein S18 acetylase RimI-like enzyme
MNIRTAIPEDIPAILTPESTVGLAPERLQFRRDAVAAGNAFVAVDSTGTVLGYAVMDYSFFSYGFVAVLYVRPEQRRRGVGSMLLRHAESICTASRLFTSTNASNRPMQALLAKLEYVYSGEVHNLDRDDPERFYTKALRG